MRGEKTRKCGSGTSKSWMGGGGARAVDGKYFALKASVVAFSKGPQKKRPDSVRSYEKKGFS